MIHHNRDCFMWVYGASGNTENCSYGPVQHRMQRVRRIQQVRHPTLPSPYFPTFLLTLLLAYHFLSLFLPLLMHLSSPFSLSPFPFPHFPPLFCSSSGRTRNIGLIRQMHESIQFRRHHQRPGPHQSRQIIVQIFSFCQIYHRRIDYSISSFHVIGITTTKC